jgi:hypothetical protein
VQNILQLNIELSDNYKFGKIIKDIISFISYRLLGIVPNLLALMNQGSELRTCLNFLLGIIEYFRYCFGGIDDAEM